jgi:hypothetical protein
VSRRNYLNHQDRKLAKREATRREHADRYADRRTDPADRLMAEKLAALADRFNGQEDHRG